METTYKGHKFILAGGDGINPLGIVRSLGEAGYKSYVVRVEEPRHTSIHTSRYVEQCTPGYGYDGVLNVCLAKYGNETLSPFVFLTDECHSEVFDRHYDDIKDKFIFYNTGEKGGLTKLSDKAYQCQLAAQSGILVPQFEVVKTGEMPKHVPYPIITKTITSNEGGWKKDMIICRNESELQEAYQHIQAKTLLIEQYIEGVNEVDYKGFSIKHGEDVFFTHVKRWKYKDKEHGHRMFFEPSIGDEMLDKLRRLIQSAHYEGIFDAEFIQDKEGNLYFLEVNWRTGMYNYNHTVEGVNLPFLWAKSMLDGKIDVDSIHPQTSKYTTLDEISLLAMCIKHPQKIFCAIREIKKADILYFYNQQDIRPFVYSLFNFFKRKFLHVIS